MEAFYRRQGVALLLPMAGMLSGCIVVRNKYSFLEFNKSPEGATTTSYFWPLVAGVLVSLLAVGILIACVYLRRRHSRSQASRLDDSQPPT